MKRILQIIENKDLLNNDFKGTIISIDGSNIKIWYDLYERFILGIDFPKYFWRNWDAFWDIITDKYFINKDIVLIIENYWEMFELYDDKKIFSRILIDWLNCFYIDVNIEIYIIN
jgi:RNAse (barnase) inhibitor barstar